VSAAALAHDALLPRAPGGNGPGLVLALAVHAALVLALTTAVDWRTKTPEVASAELWASVPQVAAPPPPPPVVTAPTPTPAPTPAPAPPPPAVRPAEPDIATERAERRKAEAARLRAEEEKAQRALADKKQRAADEARKQRELLAQQKAEAEKAAQAEKAEKADAERLARQRDENLRRIMAQAGTGTAAGATAQSAGPSASYTGRLVALVRGNLVYTGVISDNAAAEVEVTATASGTILSRRLLKSSGHKDWDDAVLRAIDRTTTLPRDTDGRVPSPIIIAFRPRD
jgi:colicin import membrane protein